MPLVRICREKEKARAKRERDDWPIPAVTFPKFVGNRSGRRNAGEERTVSAASVFREKGLSRQTVGFLFGEKKMMREKTTTSSSGKSATAKNSGRYVRILRCIKSRTPKNQNFGIPGHARQVRQFRLEQMVGVVMPVGDGKRNDTARIVVFCSENTMFFPTQESSRASSAHLQSAHTHTASFVGLQMDHILKFIMLVE